MLTLYYIIFFLILILILPIFLLLLNPLFSFIPFVPVKNKTIDVIISALELNNQSVLYDLGCGDGRVLFKIAKINKSISCIGIEIGPLPFLLAKIKNFFLNSRNVRILYGDFFNLNISNASHIFLYLFPEALDKILPKFEKELKQGTRIVSCDFQFSQKTPDKIIEIESKKRGINKRLYVYIF